MTSPPPSPMDVSCDFKKSHKGVLDNSFMSMHKDDEQEVPLINVANYR